MAETVTEARRTFQDVYSATRYDSVAYRQTYLFLAVMLIPQLSEGERTLARSLVLHMAGAKEEDHAREEAARLYEEFVESRVKPMARPGEREAFTRDLFAAIIAAIQVRPRAKNPPVGRGWVSDLLRRASADEEDAPAQTPAE